MSNDGSRYDAVLVVSFGGPEGPDDVIPFLENVLRGKRVPRERMLAVAEHYQHFGGVSPINGQCRQLIEALRGELSTRGPDLPIYWGNRNWTPFLADALREMRDNGVTRALGFVTSVFSSYSGCRQYLEDIDSAREEVGAGAPVVDKLRAFYNHPGFIESMRHRVQQALSSIPENRGNKAFLLFTAHSIPQAMADGCSYESQLHEACRLVADAFAGSRFELVYQSRSGPPSQPWLEPDVCDRLKELREQRAATDVCVVPIGFISDHMEVLYDLDTEAQQLCDELGLNMVRAETVGIHPRFIEMIGELIRERTDGAAAQAIGRFGPSHNSCPLDCCPSGRQGGNNPIGSGPPTP